ncbi:MAG: hypothetical protein AUH30_12385 [Candidatus Rokubacteria bacterium 13_1_40CM_68_15]|nr:MAG: hypothetical protein AUH30_12385 [Candidatus Rokubacteria bacterium 13_1_40CM_68_15]
MKRLLLVAGLLSCLAATADAGVTRVEISRREPFAEGQTFGTAGPYEKVVGRFFGELDAAHALNAGIVDIDRAPRNARGRVEYSADFYILKPVDLAKGNGAIFYDVNNRGNKNLLYQLNSARRANDPTTAGDAGNGFLMRHGFTVVWSGWIPGLPATNDNLRITVPVATADSTPIEQPVWDEFLFNAKGEVRALLTFPATSTDQGQATLMVRETNTAAPTILPRERWEFVDQRSIQLVPEGTAFQPGVIYQLVYRAANPPVAGIGFAATRDLVSFLRHESAATNPLVVAGKPAITRALAHGTSQSGRYLRDFVHRGFNEDEGGRIVFDGMNPHIATARLFLNQRFAQPNRAFSMGHGFLGYLDVGFPFAYETQGDPISGKVDGILSRCAARGNCPKIVHTVSSTEYWQGAQSLVATDPLGRQDAKIPDSVRIYLIAGTQHVGFPTMPAGVCSTPHNPIDLRPALRALTLALDRWVKDGTPPPGSRYPTIADATLVSGEHFTFPKIPGLAPPAAPAPRLRFDYGADSERGLIGRVPPDLLPRPYVALVPKVDADGNEIAGVRLPDVAVPLATATGWALRTASAGAAGELCYLDGSVVPFPKTAAERQARSDPRASRDERYRDQAEYVAKVGQAAALLERGGYLLAEDVQRIVERAAAIAW